MDYKKITDTINDFLVEEFEVEPESIAPEANLNETLDLDSLDYVDIVVLIEENFGFKVNPEDFRTIVSFKDFYDYIHGRVNQTAES